MFECNMCANPYPYRCSDCAGISEGEYASVSELSTIQTINSAVEELNDGPKIWIGSGEDIPAYA